MQFTHRDIEISERLASIEAKIDALISIVDRVDKIEKKQIQLISDHSSNNRWIKKILTPIISAVSGAFGVWFGQRM